MSVIVKDNRIMGIKSGYVAPAEGQELVDLKNHTLMPGLMDMHSHVDMIVDAEYYTNNFFKDDADQALRATKFSEDLLMAGFTTVRNLGGTVSLNIRDAVNAGYIPGPRIYAAGLGISTTGGHLDYTNGLNKQLSHLFGPPGPVIGIVDGPYAARQAIRQRYKDGSDVIKLAVTGGVLNMAKSADNPQFMADELEAIMEAANDYNFVVAVHAHGAENTFRNVRLAKYNLDVMDEMAGKITLSDFGGGLGTMKLCRHATELDEVRKMTEFLSPENIKFTMLDRNETFALEPSLKPLGDKVAGGIHFPEDRFGDAHQFCAELTQYLKNNGAQFLFNTTVKNMTTKGGHVNQIDTEQGSLSADAFILAAGSYSPIIANKVGIKIPVKPCKGYSLTLELDGWTGAPKIPVIDHSQHAVVTPLGNKIRVAGTAEFNGYNISLHEGRLQNLFDLLGDIFPESTPYINEANTTKWTGLRPVSASGVPIISQTKVKNLYLNTGHGHLGWTTAAASGKALSDLMCGKEAGIKLSDYSL
jgi:D-amino-acid dehydrogenase